MKSTVKKNMKRKQIKEVLSDHGICMNPFWFIAIWSLMKECDYIEIEGFGENAEFIQKNN